MISAPKPPDEDRRLEALRRYRILDTAPEQAYDDVVAIASAICGTPIALVSLVDEDRQWFKAKVGVEAVQTPREIAFCAHAILDDSTFVVPDAQEDQRFHDNPLVVGDPGIRFYAGSPIRTMDGFRLGTLCAADRRGRQLGETERLALEALSRQIGHLLELRRSVDDLARALENIRELSGIIPICSYCKSIRDDAGAWDKLERYIAEHSNAEFSHGICPSCMRREFPDVAERLGRKGTGPSPKDPPSG